MKKIQIVVVALLVTCGLVMSFSFTKKSSHKPFTLKHFVYAPFSSATDIDWNSSNKLISSDLVDANSWGTGAPGNPASHTNGSKLLAVAFNVDSVGIDVIKDRVDQYYTGNHTLPADGSSLMFKRNQGDSGLVQVTFFRTN